ncbi:MAG: diguanylate cyclase [Clostridia bacterium]|nr:diguanylate cyclase [Deltaproteobacteria bacterium]
MIGVESLRAGNLPREVADKLIASLARRLSPLMRPMDALIRAGDGVLCAVLPHLNDSDARNVAARIREASQADSVQIGTTRLSTSVSTGTATTDNELDAAKLLTAARVELVAASPHALPAMPQAPRPVSRSTIPQPAGRSERAV